MVFVSSTSEGQCKGLFKYNVEQVEESDGNNWEFIFVKTSRPHWDYLHSLWVDHPMYIFISLWNRKYTVFSLEKKNIKHTHSFLKLN